jgi:hypothetical protein
MPMKKIPSLLMREASRPFLLQSLDPIGKFLPLPLWSIVKPLLAPRNLKIKAIK